jgi:hypothetical protein
VKNYPDFFASVQKTMVLKPDGTYMLLEQAQAEQMKRAGQLTFTVPKTKAGGIDYTQRPVLTLKASE